MRYTFKEPVKKIKPKEKDTRLVTKFLFFPKIIDRQIRWLERATWKEIYWFRIDTLMIGFGWEALKWVDSEYWEIEEHGL